MRRAGVAVRWYDDEPQPGLVEVELTDRHGAVHRLVHKTCFVDDDELLLPDAEYPIDVAVRGTVVAVDGDVLTVRAHHIPEPDPSGNLLTFEVDRSDVRPVAVFLAGELCEFDAEAIALLDDDYPGVVLVEFTDACGRPHQLVDKVPYFGNHEALTPDTKYPVTVAVGECEDGVVAASTRRLTSSGGLPLVSDMPTAALRDTRTEDLVRPGWIGVLANSHAPDSRRSTSSGARQFPATGTAPAGARFARDRPGVRSCPPPVAVRDHHRSAPGTRRAGRVPPGRGEALVRPDRPVRNLWSTSPVASGVGRDAEAWRCA